MALLVETPYDTKIGDLEQPENPRLVNERGGFERPAGKPPRRGLESPAITRAAWRFDALTSGEGEVGAQDQDVFGELSLPRRR